MANLRRVHRVFRDLAYDFSAFEINHFIEHIQNLRERTIFCVPFCFSPGISGVWIPGRGTDFIFFHAHTHPIHQTHIKLHELAHMLLDHPLQAIDRVLPPELVKELGTGSGHLRAMEPNLCPNAIEEEAEYFVRLVQRGVVRAHRLAELTTSGSSIAPLRPYVTALPYGDDIDADAKV